MYSEVVWSINIMLGTLLVGVGIAIYYIFMYDTWYPNEQGEDSHPRNEDRTLSGEAEGAH